MVCKFCKEEVNDGASKCPTCGEYLGVRGAWNTLFWVVGVLIPVASILLAFIEYSGRVRAEKKLVVEEGKTVAAEEATAIANQGWEAAEGAARELSDTLDVLFARTQVAAGPAFKASLNADSIIVGRARLTPYAPVTGPDGILDEAAESLANGNWTEAEALLLQARAELRSKPDNQKGTLSFISSSLGYVYLMRGSYSQAQLELNRAIKEDATNDDARRNLALVRILKARQ